MYSEKIIAQNVSRYVESERARTGNKNFDLVYFDRQTLEEMLAHLRTITDRKGTSFTRELTNSERLFIENEIALCTLNFRYCCENYFQIELSSVSDRPEGWDELDNATSASAGAGTPPQTISSTGGGGAAVGRFILNGMQLALLQKMGELEELAYAQLAAGQPVNGILLIILKARQLGASTFSQAGLRHRVNFYDNFPALVASIDSQSTQSLNRRSSRMYDGLPFWMRAEAIRNTVDGGIEFTNGSIVQLQDFKQQKDLGKGETWRGFHGTEISSIARPENGSRDKAEDHFDEGLFPAVPYDPGVLFFMESTAKGKTGWWYEFCQSVMTGTAEGGAGRFDWFFAPFYLIDCLESVKGQKSKYRMEVPANWTPRPDTLLVAEKVAATSHLYMPDHSTVRLPPEVLYWYELTKAYFYRRGKLNVFLQSYPIEPDDSFQHSAAGAFTNETIDRLSNNCARYAPIPYRLIDAEEEKYVITYRDALYEPNVAPIHRVGGHLIAPMHPDELDKDPRGVVWVYEQPDPRWHYVLASDPTGGIPKWSRVFKTADDVGKDNAAVQVWRKQGAVRPCERCNGLGWKPTEQKGVQIECYDCDGRGRTGGRGVQCVDFAAPLDGEDLALMIYLLGKLYRGSSDNDECLAIVNWRAGAMTIRALQNKYAYTNLFQMSQVRSGEGNKLTNFFGFDETPSTVPILHARGKNAIVRRDMEPRSKWLVKELSDAVVKVYEGDGRERFFVPPGAGRHDDRMITAFLAGWVLFDWTESDWTETSADALSRDLPPARNLASTDATSEDQRRVWNESVELLLGDQDLHFGHYPDCDVTCDSDHSLDEAIYREDDDAFNDPYSYRDADEFDYDEFS